MNDTSNDLNLGPGDKIYQVRYGTIDAINGIITKKINLSNKEDRTQLIQIISNYKFQFKLQEIEQILGIITKYLENDWLIIYPGGILKIQTEPKIFYGLGFFNHLIPLGYALLLLENKIGFSEVVKNLNRPTHERISSLLQFFCASRYSKMGYGVELEPKTDFGKCDFKVNLDNEWIYFEIKAINIHANESAKKNEQFIHIFQKELNDKIKNKIPNNYRLDVILDIKPDETEVKELLMELQEKLPNLSESKTVKKNYGEYTLNKKEIQQDLGPGKSRMTQIVVGTSPTIISTQKSDITLSWNLFGSKLEQKFREKLKEARAQIPTGNRGIIIIYGLNESKAQEIMQERIVNTEYSNIICIIAVGNGANMVRRADHSDINIDFIKVCQAYSIFYDFDLGNHP